MKQPMSIKQMIIKSKYRKARLSAIRKLVQGIPTNVRFEYYDDDDFQNGTERGRSDLANEIRKILNEDPFIDAQRPGNTENGKPKVKK